MTVPLPEDAKWHNTDNWDTLKTACDNVGERVDPYITGSTKVSIRVADARRLLSAARFFMETTYEI